MIFIPDLNFLPAFKNYVVNLADHLPHQCENFSNRKYKSQYSRTYLNSAWWAFLISMKTVTYFLMTVKNGFTPVILLSESDSFFLDDLAQMIYLIAFFVTEVFKCPKKTPPWSMHFCWVKPVQACEASMGPLLVAVAIFTSKTLAWILLLFTLSKVLILAPTVAARWAVKVSGPSNVVHSKYSEGYLGTHFL